MFSQCMLRAPSEQACPMFHSVVSWPAAVLPCWDRTLFDHDAVNFAPAHSVATVQELTIYLLLGQLRACGPLFLQADPGLACSFPDQRVQISCATVQFVNEPFQPQTTNGIRAARP